MSSTTHFLAFIPATATSEPVILGWGETESEARMEADREIAVASLGDVTYKIAAGAFTDDGGFFTGLARLGAPADGFILA